MGRAPCCEKANLNKGSWTPKEDERLVAYINKYGHGNWRSLPKRAGLLRCGKSCRLRWINYLRPDIIRGNFTQQEEDTIIKLHGLLGNKWAKIASYLPGRTDNEIKNVWNTHLKKRLVAAQKTPTAAETPRDLESTRTTSSHATSVSDDVESKCSADHGEVLSGKMIEILDGVDSWDSFARTGQVVDEISTKAIVGDEESRRWLAYLEAELGLFDGVGVDEDEVEMAEDQWDAVRMYFSMV
ncbi:hypothetical protein HPP92_014227 [Vanilla planifolia]|uniref:Uncharacterized protein n=1 Tax=Vanilla planifolia TaxID=51239 RepID=A0A835QP23_VANPL|nr:hypothetical protein HPP92_014227 [Vanilla planifolia]